MLREWWAGRRRAKVRARLAAAGHGQRAGKRFADGVRVGTDKVSAAECADVRRFVDYPIVSTAHAELYEYEEPDDAEPGLRP